ncbi:ArsR family transcriptional regulator [Haloprofundus halobius]|uniref:ArsR family transcriptional regulator n=1 Tax=Haloprofundus halobius TaxID=2876194 RepID=UPI001CCB628E|nr:ArsR family transcriptional regulator [Haloprofundus halobius]
MIPETEPVPEDETNEGETAFDTWRALQRATDKKRADILTDIVGHPVGAPSVEELDYMNPPLSDDSIRRHLNTLTDVDVVRVREFKPGSRIRGYPYQFFELTPEARDLFDRNGLFPEDAWKRQYAAVEKTSRIKELESMPRPDI